MSLSLRLPQNIEERLKNLSNLTRRTKTYYITEAIKKYLDDLEDIYLAEQRLIDVCSGKSKTDTLEEVEKELGLGC